MTHSLTTEGWRGQSETEAADVLDHAGAILTRAGNQPVDGSDREWQELRARAIAAALEVTGNTGLAEASADAVLSVCDDAARDRMAHQLMEAFRIRSVDFRAGAAMDVTAAREIAALWVGAARGLLGDTANHTEMEVAVAGDAARYIFRLERRGHLTPHQDRRQDGEHTASPRPLSVPRHGGQAWCGQTCRDRPVDPGNTVIWTTTRGSRYLLVSM